MDESVAEHIPCKTVVTRCARVACLDDIEPADLREQHTDNGHIRHEGSYLVLHALVAVCFQKGGHEARAVVAVDLKYPVLYLLGHRAGGVNGEVSALGVAADDDGAVVGRGRPLKVCLGVQLRGYDLFYRKLAVFLPADYRVVGAAERDILHAVR